MCDVNTKGLTCTLFIKMTLRKLKAKRKQDLVGDLEEMKQELKKVSMALSEYQKVIFS